jgi:hypothetical protein
MEFNDKLMVRLQEIIYPYVNFSQMYIKRNMIWICIAYKMYKNFTMQIKYIYIIWVLNNSFLKSYNTTKNSNNFQSVFGVRRDAFMHSEKNPIIFQ